MALLFAGCSAAGHPGSGLADPAQSVSPNPDYPETCAPVGADTTVPCLRITLDAIDAARAKEGVRPMVLPAGFARLSVPEQLFVAIDRERVDRGLAPFPGLTAALNADAQKGAASAPLPTPSGPGLHVGEHRVDRRGRQRARRRLRVALQRRPRQRSAGLFRLHVIGLWADRQLVLSRFGSRHLVMGAAFDATGDTSSEDRGGSSVAATLAVTTKAGPYTYTWKQALAAMSAGHLLPLRAIPASESNTGISDPTRNVTPVPDFTRRCGAGGIDNAPTCLDAVLDAVNHAHVLEGIQPMVLPTDFAR